MIPRAVLALVAALVLAPTARAVDAWPMAGHDAANTNRSDVVSAQGPALVPGWPRSGLSGAPLVAPGGAVERWAEETPLLTEIVNRDGTRRRTIPVGPLSAIGPDGRIYAVIGGPGAVSAHTPAGDLLWRSADLGLGPEVSSSRVRPSPDGNVYVAGEDGMVALDSSGAIRWRETWRGPDLGRLLAVARDGTLYLGLEETGVPVLEARRPDGRTLWRRALGPLAGRAAVAHDGTVIVVAGGSVVALRPDGGERWRLPRAGASGMAVAGDGGVYLTTPGVVRGRTVVRPGVVSAIAPDGSVRWTHRGGAIGWGDPIVGGDGTVYVGGSPLTALRRDGTRAWAFPPTSAPLVPVAIGADGTLFAAASGYSTLLALAGPSAPARVAPPTNARQRALVAGLRVRPARFRMDGAVSLCPAPGRPCRPPTPLGAMAGFTLKRDSAVLMVVRGPGGGVLRRSPPWHMRAGTAWTSLRDVAGNRALAPGRYTLTLRAAAGATRSLTRPAPFTVVRG